MPFGQRVAVRSRRGRASYPEPKARRRPRREPTPTPVPGADAAGAGPLRLVDILGYGDVRERPKRHDWKSCDPKGSKGSNPFVSATGLRALGENQAPGPTLCLPARPITLMVVVLGGGLGVPCTGNPLHAGLINRPRPMRDRAALGEQC